jgi:hypothetical protein
MKRLLFLCFLLAFGFFANQISRSWLFLGESAGPDRATWRPNRDDLVCSLKDDKMPTVVDASNRHGGRSGAVRIYTVGAGNSLPGDNHASEIQVIHPRNAAVGLERNLPRVREGHETTDSREAIPISSGDEAMGRIAIRVAVEDASRAWRGGHQSESAGANPVGCGTDIFDLLALTGNHDTHCEADAGSEGNCARGAI